MWPTLRNALAGILLTLTNMNAEASYPIPDHIGYVIVASHDRVFCRRLVRTLRQRGIRVVESEPTFELLKRLSRRDERPDLLVLDISDAPGTGLVLQQVVRVEAWRLPLIVTTCSDDKLSLPGHLSSILRHDRSSISAQPKAMSIRC